MPAPGLRRPGNGWNRFVYRLWAPFYDLVFDPLYRGGRRRAVRSLGLRPGEQLLVSGVGTGLDLEFVPAGVDVIGVDISEAMLARARRRARPGTILVVMDAEHLAIPDETVDAVLCDLILSVVPDGGAAMHEAWRVLRPGGRVAIFDKFLANESDLTVARRLSGLVIRLFGTDVNRRLADIVDGLAGLRVVRDEPHALGGRYRVVLIEKTSSG